MRRLVRRVEVVLSWRLTYCISAVAGMRKRRHVVSLAYRSLLCRGEVDQRQLRGSAGLASKSLDLL